MKFDLVKRAFSAVENNDVEGYVALFSDDAIYKAGNLDPAVGPDGIRQFAGPIMQMFSKVSHDVKGMWQEGENTVIAELVLTYVRAADNKSIDIPCLDIIQFEGDKIKSLQAYLDASPLFA